MNNSIKKIICIVLMFAVIFSFGCINSYAAQSADIRQVNVNLPDVTFELEGSYSKDDIASIKLDNEKLKISDTYKADKSNNKLIYLLVDISTSMSQSALDSLKPELNKFVSSLGDDDKLVLMTFGTKVTTVIKGTESKNKIINVINSLKCNSPGTTFYKALTKALDNSINQNNYDRKYAIVVSDGADYEKGNSSQEEVIDKLETNRLPIYGMCLASASQGNANGFGYISRESGGELVKFSKSDSKKKFQSLKKIINDVTIVKALSKNKKSVGNRVLSVKLNKEKNKTAEEIVFVKARNDKTKPEIKEISFDKETNSFIFKFSENVENADKISSYRIKKGKNELNIVSVKYNENEYAATVCMDKKIYSGDYAFDLTDIVDASDNQNRLKKTSYNEKIKANHIIIKILLIAAIILVPILFLLAVYLILLNLKKKKNVEKIKDIFVAQVEEKEYEHIHIEQPKGRQIKFSIDAGNGQYHNIDFNLIKSVIIGRSDICDLTIDDDKMSRQHFVIEDVESGLAVTDLDTTNGTFVNGIKINSRTFIDSGAKIFAGNSVITVNY